MRKQLWIAVVVGGCASQPMSEPHAPSPAPMAAPMPAPTNPPTTPAVPPPVPRAAKASLVHALTAGPRPQLEVRQQLESALADVAACNIHDEASVTLELMFAITTDGRIAHVDTRAAPPMQACVAKALGSAETKLESKGEPTDVYAAIAIDVDAMAPAARPSAPDLKHDFEEACSMFVRSGAMKEQDGQHKQQLAKEYFRSHVRHPELHHMAWQIANANPADRRYIGPALRKRAQPKLCEDPGW